MGILNMTPDSFSDGGAYATVQAAVKRAVEMEQSGANIIDIGGESTRPGHEPVSVEEEIARVVPIIEAVADAVRIPISIDTYKGKTARAALEAGAEIINDVWGAKHDPEIAEVAAEYSVPIVLTHNRTHMKYTDLLTDIRVELEESVQICVDAGVEITNVIVDPGIGFAKTQEQNLQVMNQLDKLAALGYPLVLGTSRKGFIGKILEVDEATGRDIGTGATTCLGIAKGANIIRVHNVSVTKELVTMTDAILNS